MLFKIWAPKKHSPAFVGLLNKFITKKWEAKLWHVCTWLPYHAKMQQCKTWNSRRTHFFVQTWSTGAKLRFTHGPFSNQTTLLVSVSITILPRCKTSLRKWNYVFMGNNLILLSFCGKLQIWGSCRSFCNARFEVSFDSGWVDVWNLGKRLSFDNSIKFSRKIWQKKSKMIVFRFRLIVLRRVWLEEHIADHL